MAFSSVVLKVKNFEISVPPFFKFFTGSFLNKHYFKNLKFSGKEILMYSYEQTFDLIWATCEGADSWKERPERESTLKRMSARLDLNRLYY